jgi:hypothetical protein
MEVETESGGLIMPGEGESRSIFSHFSNGGALDGCIKKPTLEKVSFAVKGALEKYAVSDP